MDGSKRFNHPQTRKVNMNKSVATNPVTKEEWQEAVNAANTCLILDSCVQYGLIQRVPIDEQGNRTKDWWYRDSGVNVARCQEILERGAFLNIYPQE